MRGGLVGSICFLVFLLLVECFEAQAKDLVISKDLKRPVVKRSSLYEDDDITRSGSPDLGVTAKDHDSNYNQLVAESSGTAQTELDGHHVVSADSNAVASAHNQDISVNSLSGVGARQYGAGNLGYKTQQFTSISSDYVPPVAVINEEEDILAGGSNDEELRRSAFASAVANVNSGTAIANANSEGSSQFGLISDSVLAKVNAEMNSGGSRPYGFGYVPSVYKQGYPGSGHNSAQAQANAQGNSGGYPGSGYNYAQAKTNAQANSGGIVPISSKYSPSLYNPGSPGSGYKLTDAQAIAQANTGGYFGSEYNSAKALANAQSSSGRLMPNIPGYSPPLYGPGSSGSGYNLAEAKANALANSVGYLGSDNNSAQALANAQMNSGGHPGFDYNFAQGLANAEANAQYGTSNAEAIAQTNTILNSQLLYPNGQDFVPSSKRIPESEFIIPYLIPGLENVITCQREGELHQLWSPLYQCTVCTCVTKFGFLTPVCASCLACSAPASTLEKPLSLPPSPMTPLPPPTPPPPPPPPPPSPQESCDPLPMNQQFQNPLNPCQICVCSYLVNIFSKPDISITCEENPQCVIPPDTPILPLPMPPSPIPLPLCASLPKNVLFPHPKDVCTMCKCIAQVSPFDIVEQYIQCIANPKCVNPSYFPTQPPVDIYPTELPVSNEPFPISPDTITLTPDTFPIPVPWPPVISANKLPGPLPGPPPHESCRPYPPNTPFTHPWDDCQICECTEAHSFGNINIEVNCYTKPSCCVEPPIPRLPAKPSQLKILDNVCEFKSFGVEFLHPQDSCRLCNCELYGKLVIPTCRRVNRPECLAKPAPVPPGQLVYIEPRCRYHLPNQQFVVDCNVCVCQSVLNYVIARCSPRPDCTPTIYPGSNKNQGQGFLIPEDGQSSAPGKATGLYYPRQTSLYQPDSVLASADATAFGPSYEPGLYTIGQQTPFYQPSSVSSSADASALVSSYEPELYVPGHSPFYKPSSGSTSADASAFASSYEPELYVPGQSHFYQPSSGSTSADASAFVSSYEPESYVPGQSPFYQPSSGSTSADALAFVSSYQPRTYVPGQSPFYQPSSGSASAISNDFYPYQMFNMPAGSYNSLQNQHIQSSSSAQAITSGDKAESEASASASNDYFPYSPNSNSYPYFPINQNQGESASAQATADVSHGTQSSNGRYYYSPNSNLYSPNANSYPYNLIHGQPNTASEGLGASQLYPTLYPKPVSQQTPLFIPGRSDMLAQTIANVDASGQSSGRGLCKYDGDMYHHNCQACFCVRDEASDLISNCLGNPCS